MLVSTSTGKIASVYGDKEAIRLIKEAGFTAYDFELGNLFSSSRESCLNRLSGDYVSLAKELRAFADSIGIVCNQAHAPFPTSLEKRFADVITKEEIFEIIIKSMEFASILGAKCIVVHPNQELWYPEHIDELFENNVKFYKSLIPYCEKYGIKVACENMWQENPKTNAITDSTCSRAWEFCKYLDAIDSDWIVGCLDLGHTSLVAADTVEFIKKMGAKRLQALHVHDTDFVHDLHTLPFTGKMSFEPIMKALAEIGYEGDFTYEAMGFLNGFPTDFYPTVLEFKCKVAHRLIEFM